MHQNDDETDRADNPRVSSGTTSSSRCSSTISSLSEYSNATGESLQEAKKRALKELRREGEEAAEIDRDECRSFVLRSVRFKVR